MFVRSTGIALLATVCLAIGTVAQGIPSPDLRALTLRSLHTGQNIRIVGALIGTVVGLVTIAHKSCQFGDVRCTSGAYAETTGIALGGTLIGALIGSGTRTWRLRYP